MCLECHACELPRIAKYQLHAGKRRALTTRGSGWAREKLGRRTRVGRREKEKEGEKISNEKKYLVKKRKSAAGYQTKQVNKNTIGMTLTRDDWARMADAHRGCQRSPETRCRYPIPAYDVKRRSTRQWN